MAVLQALNNYLTSKIGIVDPNLQTALNGQGLLSITDFETLEEYDIESMCNNILKPGGTIQIANPAHDPNNVCQGIPPGLQAPNPGVRVPVGHILVKRLKMLQYYMAHLKRISVYLIW
jgi:hypothetical protein